MNANRTLLAIGLAALLPMAGCLGLFSGDDDQTDTDSQSLDESVGNETARQIEAQASQSFTNYTVPGQEDLPDELVWFNGTLSADGSAASWEDKNDRAGTNYNTEIRKQDISDMIPEDQPAEVNLKLFYIPGPGSSAQVDVFVNVPGTHTEFSGDDCDEFSWKICVQEMTVDTVGKSDQPAEVGVQISNNRAILESLDYHLKVEVAYEDDVIAPTVPYVVDVPQNATGLIVNSEKPGSDHIDGEFLVIGPDDQLVEHVEYNDLALATESKFIPVEQAGEHILYPLHFEGGFLSVEADTPVPTDQLDMRTLSTTTERVELASQPDPNGVGAGCVPVGGGCQNQTMVNSGTTSFSVEGTFPLEVDAWINQEGSPNANLDAEVRIKSDNGLVAHTKKWLQYEDERGTIGSTRDEINHFTYPENLVTGQYDVEYVIDGTGSLGYELTTYER